MKEIKERIEDEEFQEILNEPVKNTYKRIYQTYHEQWNERNEFKPHPKILPKLVKITGIKPDKETATGLQNILQSLGVWKYNDTIKEFREEVLYPESFR